MRNGGMLNLTVLMVCLSLFGCEWLFPAKEKQQPTDTSQPLLPVDVEPERVYPEAQLDLILRAQSYDGVIWLRSSAKNRLNYRKSIKVNYGWGTRAVSSIEECKALPFSTSISYYKSYFRLRLVQMVGKIKQNQGVVACIWQQGETSFFKGFTVATSENPDAMNEKLPAINNYGRLCRAKIGPVPVLNCLDGDELKIKVDGEEKEPGKILRECDNPINLEQPGGQCVSGSYLLSTDTNDPDVELVMICRKYKERPEGSPLFDDIAIIHYRRSTGDTCFYQMPNLERNATRVPPPAETSAETPSGELTASAFWLTPKKTAGRYCYKCHDSDPFIHNPWVSQSGKVPSATFNKYNILGEAFRIWPQVYSVEPQSVPANRCTQCHRIGKFGTCDKLIMHSVGKGILKGMSQRFFKTMEAVWMPPGHGHNTRRAWDLDYGRDYNDLLECCQRQSTADSTKCRYKPITSSR